MSVVVPARIPEDVEVLGFLARARALTVTDDRGYQFAGELLVEGKRWRARMDETFDPIIRTAHEAHRVAIAQARVHTGPLDEAEAIIKSKGGLYLLERQRLEFERQRAQQEAERLRLEAEREAERKRLWAEGQRKAAMKVAAAPVVVAPPPPPAPLPKVAGVTTRRTFNFAIVDPAEIPREFMAPDTVKIGKLVRSLGLEAQGILGTGVRVFEQDGMSATAAAKGA